MSPWCEAMRYLPLVMLSSLLGAVEVELDPGILDIHVDDAAGYRVVATTIDDIRGDIQLRKEAGKVHTSFQVTYVEEDGHRSQEYRASSLSPKDGPVIKEGLVPDTTVRSFGISQTISHPTRHAYVRISYLCIGGEGPAPTTWPDGFTFTWLGADHK